MKKTIKFIALLFIIVTLSCQKDEVTAPTSTTPPTTTPPVATKSSAKDITKFSFAALSPAVDAKIDAAGKTINSLLPAGSDITKLIPTITLSDKASISPASGVAQDFTKEVSYTVTAEDGSTISFTAKAATDAYYYSNIRMTVGENKGKISENDSSLLDYKTGKVYLLKDGAKYAINIDLILDNYCGLTLNTPVALKNCGVSCGLGGVNSFVKPQNWSIYRVGDIDNIQYNEIKAGSYQYAQIPISEWNNLSFAADIDSKFIIGRKLDANNTSNISSSTIVGLAKADCIPAVLYDKVLYRIISQEGKKGVLRVTSFGKKASGATYVTMDIKIQK